MTGLEIKLKSDVATDLKLGRKNDMPTHHDSDGKTLWQQRQKKLSSFLTEGEALVLTSGRDGHLQKFRAQSSFFYMTGLNEPDAVAVFRPWHENPYVLFLRPEDPVAELWDGARLGVEGALEQLGCSESFSIQKLEEELPKLLSSCSLVYYSIGQDRDWDRLFLDSRSVAQSLNRRSGISKASIADPQSVIGEMRLIKSPQEIAILKKAVEASVEGHKRAKAYAEPGRTETEIYGQLVSGFYDKGAFREGYSAIVASGPNATTLHYRDNNRVLQDNDLLLIDAGAELGFYTADITRTFAVSGAMTEAQGDLYQAVLDVQERLIQKVEPTRTSVNDLQTLCCRWIAEKLVDLKLLSGPIDEIIESKSYQKYYPHGVGHYLGMDVHDVGTYKRSGKNRELEAGMVLTIEPGIYIPPEDESAPLELRGQGVRIEDDILVTSSGHENLTEALDKSAIGMGRLG